MGNAHGGGGRPHDDASGGSRTPTSGDGAVSQQTQSPTSPASPTTRSSPPLPPRGGGGDGGSVGSPTAARVLTHLARRSGGAAGGGGDGITAMGMAAATAADEATSPAAITQQILATEPGVGTELPPLPLDVTSMAAAASSEPAAATVQPHEMPHDVVDINENAAAATTAAAAAAATAFPILSTRTASFRAADAAARTLLLDGAGAAGAGASSAASSADTGGLLNEFGHPTQRTTSDLFRGASNTSLASSVGVLGTTPQDRDLHPHALTMLGTLGEADRNEEEEEEDMDDDDEDENENHGRPITTSAVVDNNRRMDNDNVSRGDATLATTPPVNHYYSTGLHLSGGDGLDAMQRERQGQLQQQHDVAAASTAGLLDAPDLMPEDTSNSNAGNLAVVEDEEGTGAVAPQEQPQQPRQISRRSSDIGRTSTSISGQGPQPQSSQSSQRRASVQNIPLSSSSSIAQQQQPQAPRRLSSVSSHNSRSTASNTNNSLDGTGITSSAAPLDVSLAQNPYAGTTSLGRLRNRRPSAETRRSSDSGHVLFSWGEDDSFSDISTAMQESASLSGNPQQPMAPFQSAWQPSQQYDQYRRTSEGMETMPEDEEEEEEEEEQQELDIIRGGGRTGSEGAYTLYGDAAAIGSTDRYAIGRSQSVQDMHHHNNNQVQVASETAQTPSIAIGAAVSANAYATPQDLGVPGTSSDQGNDDVPDFVAEPLEQSEYTRDPLTMATSVRLGPVPFLASRRGSGSEGGVSGSATAPATSGLKRRQRSNSAERHSGARGGGPCSVFSLMSRELTGRLPPSGGVDRMSTVSHPSSYLATLEGGYLYPRPSGVQDKRLEDIHLRDEFYANNGESLGQSESQSSTQDQILNNDPSRPFHRVGRSNRADSQSTSRYVDRPPHRNAPDNTPGRPLPLSQNSRLRRCGGKLLFQRIDRAAGGIASEAELLGRALSEADWAEVSVIVNRLASRLIGPIDAGRGAGSSGDANGNGSGVRRIDGAGANSGTDGTRPPSIIDPHNPTYPPHYAGGGRLGLERLTFVQSSGVSLLINVLRNPAFVGFQTVSSNDARNIPSDLVSAKLAPTWNEVMACLREMAYSMPELVTNGGEMNEGGRLVPYLFTMLSHDSVFDGAASLLEELLSLQSQIGGPFGATPATGSGGSSSKSAISSACAINGIFTPHPPPPPLTFSLTQVTDLYSLWSSFNPRKLAHFCRILALLVFEPEDRQLMESTSVLKSVELLQLRRDRAARSGGGIALGGGDGCAVDRNQSVMLGDERLIQRLLSLLNIMNYAPDMGRGASAYHVMAHFPWIADTLLMLGLSELDNWSEVGRLDRLARPARDDTRTSDLGSVAAMLESLSEPLFNPPSNDGQNDLGAGIGGVVGNSNATHLGHIIQVINAAQRAGVIVGQRRRVPAGQDGANEEGSTNEAELGAESSTAGSGAGQDDPSSANVSVRAYPVSDASGGDAAAARVVVEVQGAGQEQPPTGTADTDGTDGLDRPSSRRSRRRISQQRDAANEMQFNALLLAPYQVEVLFVLCTLLGGRRKVDAQTMLGSFGLVPLLDEMFDRLGWASSSQEIGSGAENDASHTHSNSTPGNGNGYGQAASAIFGIANSNDGEEEDGHAGIHGPGCECNPESALRVQYLRLLHNFCDRDCDNYYGRRLLLSSTERERVFSDNYSQSMSSSSVRGKRGLLSKIIVAYKAESDDSPYKFWLASCAEAYLRGSAPQEQCFAAKSSGLLHHLVADVLDDRLHCAGSLQTAFDLLGELCKGNAEALCMLLQCLGTEERFQRLMSVAASNLVDSNVFVRALLLSVERVTSLRQNELREAQRRSTMRRHGHRHNHRHNHRHGRSPSPSNPTNTSSTLSNDNSTIAHEPDEEYFLPWLSDIGSSSQAYLTHTWWDVPSASLPVDAADEKRETHSLSLDLHSHEYELVGVTEAQHDNNRRSDWYPPMPSLANNEVFPIFGGHKSQYSMQPSTGQFGWLFSPHDIHAQSDDPVAAAYSVDGLFAETFRPNSIERLAWCLAVNEARLLRDLLRAVDLRNVNHENICCLNTAIVLAVFAHRRKKLPSLINELCRMNDENKDTRRADSDLASGFEGLSLGEEDSKVNSVATKVKRKPSIGDRSDVLRNFRELLWFWKEYYTHRGRDRLSLEFSSHIRFQEWNEVVERLCADDGSDTALLSSPVRLPKSPFRRAPRTVDLRLPSISS